MDDVVAQNGFADGSATGARLARRNRNGIRWKSRPLGRRVIVIRDPEPASPGDRCKSRPTVAKAIRRGNVILAGLKPGASTEGWRLV